MISISRLKWILYPQVFQFKWAKIIKSNNRDWILGRVACLGHDVYKLLDSDIPIYNIQKGRVDYLNAVAKNKNVKARTAKVSPFILRKDIKGLIAQQEIFKWESTGMPKAIFMDSFSELTDQLFTRRTGNWSFCANYTDIIHSKTFSDKFEAIGLLPNENIETEYRKYFQFVRTKFPDTPIIFIHFPVKLESREKFHLRYQFIKNAIEKISKEYRNFYSLMADNDIVDWPEEREPGLENFPYHFNKGTYSNLAKQVRSTNIFN